MKSLKKYCEEYLGNLGMLKPGVLGHKPQIDDSVYEKQKEEIVNGITGRRKVLKIFFRLVVSALCILFVSGILVSLRLMDKYVDTPTFLKIAVIAFSSMTGAAYYLQQEISRIDHLLIAMPILTPREVAKVVLNVYYKILK